MFLYTLVKVFRYVKKVWKYLSSLFLPFNHRQYKENILNLVKFRIFILKPNIINKTIFWSYLRMKSQFITNCKTLRNINLMKWCKIKVLSTLWTVRCSEDCIKSEGQKNRWKIAFMWTASFIKLLREQMYVYLCMYLS